MKKQMKMELVPPFFGACIKIELKGKNKELNEIGDIWIYR